MVVEDDIQTDLEKQIYTKVYLGHHNKYTKEDNRKNYAIKEVLANSFGKAVLLDTILHDLVTQAM